MLLSAFSYSIPSMLFGVFKISSTAAFSSSGKKLQSAFALATGKLSPDFVYVASFSLNLVLGFRRKDAILEIMSDFFSTP